MEFLSILECQDPRTNVNPSTYDFLATFLLSTYKPKPTTLNQRP